MFFPTAPHRDCDPRTCSRAANVAELEEELQAAHGAIDSATTDHDRMNVPGCGLCIAYSAHRAANSIAEAKEDKADYAAHDRCFYDPPIASFPLTFPICATGI